MGRQTLFNHLEELRRSWLCVFEQQFTQWLNVGHFFCGGVCWVHDSWLSMRSGKGTIEACLPQLSNTMWKLKKYLEHFEVSEQIKGITKDANAMSELDFLENSMVFRYKELVDVTGSAVQLQEQNYSCYLNEELAQLNFVSTTTTNFHFAVLLFYNIWIYIITRGRKFRLCFLLLSLVVFWISCAVTRPKLGLSLGTKVKICCTIDSRWLSSAVGRYWAGRLDVDVFGFFLLINSSSRLHRCCQSDDR